MKKKVVVALIMSITLTLGTAGTVFATSNIQTTKAQSTGDNHEGMVWIVDKVAYDEVVKHPEEGHYETQKVLVKDAWDEQVRAPWLDEYKMVYVCNGCGAQFDEYEQWKAHDQEMIAQGDYSHGGYHDDQVLVKEGYETVHHDAIYEDKDVWVVDKAAWDETVHHPEEGHWEPIKDDNTDTDKPDNSNPDTENPNNSKPDTESPDNSEPNTENPDNSNPNTGNPDTSKPDDSNTDNKQDMTEDKTNNKTDNKTDGNKVVNVSTNKIEKKTDSKSESQKTDTTPKTGDPTNLAYLATLAGSAIVGGGTLGWKFRKRK